MTDILIRNVDDDDVARIDASARKLGLSRNEYLRRAIARDSREDRVPISVDDLRRLNAMSADLLDEDIMREAWS